MITKLSFKEKQHFMSHKTNKQKFRANKGVFNCCLNDSRMGGTKTSIGKDVLLHSFGDSQELLQ